MASPIIFEDIFEITHLNPEGKKFDLVNRLSALGTTFECDLLLDYNCQIYSLLEGEKMTLVLASTLNLDGSPDDHTSYTPMTSMQREATLADSYEYVMHGRVFDVGYKKDGVVQIAISFGGLLCRLTGDQRHLSNVVPDMRLYVLIKKD
jgi:DNA-directed RNA polymerase I, II, and III subunit RPABC3